LFGDGILTGRSFFSDVKYTDFPALLVEMIERNRKALELELGKEGALGHDIQHD
jgi:hypothetical protein